MRIAKENKHISFNEYGQILNIDPVIDITALALFINYCQKEFIAKKTLFLYEPSSIFFINLNILCNAIIKNIKRNYQEVLSAYKESMLIGLIEDLAKITKIGVSEDAKLISRFSAEQYFSPENIKERRKLISNENLLKIETLFAEIIDVAYHARRLKIDKMFDK